MPTSRRNFLRSSAAAALFASLALHPLKAAFAQKSTSSQSTTQDAGTTNYEIPQEALRDRVFYFTKATFEPHLKTDFVVRAGVIVTTLRLVAIADCASASDGAGECFSLTFLANRELSDVRTIHVFEHAALGEFNMFVSPTEKLRDPDGLYYVAIINHQTSAGAPSPRKTSIAPSQKQP